jgi:hypothetical protein
MAEPVRQYLVDEQGRRVAVVLDIAVYERLMEDLHDLAIVAERQTEASLTLDELRQRLTNHANIPDPH